jgi:electron transfer flavoprotein alpha subunit
MAEIFVLVEHRKGEIRDITFEMLTKGKEIAGKLNAELCAVLLGKDVAAFADKLKKYAKKVLVVEDEKLRNFNAEAYQKVLSHLIKERKPSLVLIGHTSFGMDLAPALSVELGLPLATDCIGIELDGGKIAAIRQVYGGKVNARVLLKGAQGILTIRSAAFQAAELGPTPTSGEVVSVKSPLTEDIKYKKFVEYIEAAAGAVDISQASVLVSIGRGIGDAENIPIAEELAKTLGGVVACSRPVVDKKWMPKERQVGTSGKVVKPKVYIALGISGAFQHLAGMSASETIIAVNKDAKAPIFTAAHYGVVGDLFKVVPALTEKIKEMKGGK